MGVPLSGHRADHVSLLMHTECGPWKGVVTDGLNGNLGLPPGRHPISAVAAGQSANDHCTPNPDRRAPCTMVSLGQIHGIAKPAPYMATWAQPAGGR